MVNKRSPFREPPKKPIWKKSFAEMDLTETTDWVAGQLSISLGQGTFRSTVCGIISGLMHSHFQRGREAGIKEERERARSNRRSKR